MRESIAIFRDALYTATQTCTFNCAAELFSLRLTLVRHTFPVEFLTTSFLLLGPLFPTASYQPKPNQTKPHLTERTAPHTTLYLSLSQSLFKNCCTLGCHKMFPYSLRSFAIEEICVAVLHIQLLRIPLAT